MTRRQAIAAITVLTMACRRTASKSEPDRYVAFSLRAAEARLKANRDVASIQSLAGIRKLLGYVRDPETRDHMLVGVRHDDGPEIALDDFVAALRAIVVRGQYPLVSIDRTATTRESGTQRVRFEGVSESSFAQHLLAADITLKRAALNMVTLPIASYFAMCEKAARDEQLRGDIGSRLWFHAHDVSLLEREDVVAIRRLKVGVKAEVIGAAPDQRDEVADRYAALFTEQFDPIGQQFPELRRLTALFELVAVCRGLETAPRPDLDYWLHEYAVRPVTIPGELAVMKQVQQIETPHGKRSLEIEGGIDMRLLNLRLNAADHMAFRDAVVRTRPDAQALVWPVPLQAWRFSGAASTVPMVNAASAPVGAHLERRMAASVPRPVDAPRGGVKANVVIRPEDIEKKR
jgi:hypothetical protein